MQKPVIGITPRIIVKEQFPMIGSPRSYIRALTAVGALPVVLPVGVSVNVLDELLDQLDGVVFSGGGDIETERFNGLPHEKIYDINPERDQMEIDVTEMVLRRKMPFLGICRGIQLLNVALGGTLYTHILDQLPGALDHSFKDGRAPEEIIHTIRLEPGSCLAQIIGEPEIEVNSLHHQGVWEIGEGLTATGYAPDGLVEAVELPDYPFGIAVQWHPEWLPEQAHATRLFEAFVTAALENRTR
ncbi:MAG: gamma-glutamyl-gamma-aminobutyrate hydrolase family protein [Anaerolineales bacterium]|nr:gamma-glutamyl-gamma-aminobutyrate hydrolase family protein [Anaerolineales bacterium]